MCFKFLAVPAVMLAALSCSIKEDRSKCPCILIMDLEEVPWNTPEEGFPLSLQVSGPGGFSLENPVSVEECSTSYTVEVPRQGVYSSLLTSPAGDFFVGGRGIVIPEGKDCTPLWMYSRFLDTSVEDIREKVVMIFPLSRFPGSSAICQSRTAAAHVRPGFQGRRIRRSSLPLSPAIWYCDISQ